MTTLPDIEKLVERLDGAGDVLDIPVWQDHALAVKDARAALLAYAERVKELEEALKPFAKFDEGIDPAGPYEEWFRHDGEVLYVRDFLNARAALKESPNG
jgi:hypothetical protein